MWLQIKGCCISACAGGALLCGALLGGVLPGPSSATSVELLVSTTCLQTPHASL